MDSDARTWWQDEGRKTERYVAYPCHGMNKGDKRNPPRHVFEILDCGGANEARLGFVSLEEARILYGEGNVFVTTGSSICPECLTVFTAPKP